MSLERFIPQKVAGLWWRCKIVPSCEHCGNDMQVTQHQRCLKIECRECNIEINRCLPADALLQTLTDVMANRFSTGAPTESDDSRKTHQLPAESGLEADPPFTEVDQLFPLPPFSSAAAAPLCAHDR